MAANGEEEEYGYESSSVPGTPKHSGDGEEKKKKKKLGSPMRKLIPSFSSKKSPIDLERAIGKDDEGAPSPSKRFNLKKLFKRSETHKDDIVDNSHHLAKEDEQSKPEHNKETHDLSEKNAPKNEVLKEDTKSNKHASQAKETVVEPIKSHEKAKEDVKTHPHKDSKATAHDKGKSKLHQEPIAVASEVQDKGVHKHDHKGDAEDEKSVDTISQAAETPVTKEEGFGCESLAKGVQRVCLPWTMKKEDQ